MTGVSLHKAINLVNDLSQTYIFATVALFKASLIEFPDGKTIRLLDRGADYTKAAGTGSDNDSTIIDSTSVSQNLALTITNQMHVSQFGIEYDTGDQKDKMDLIFASACQILDCTPPSGSEIKVSPLTIPLNMTLFSSGNSTPTFRALGVSCFESSANVSLINVGTTIKDMMILGTASTTTLIIDAFRLRKFELNNVRLRDIDMDDICYRDFAGNDNRYNNVFAEGRVVYTGTTTTELGTNVKTNNLTMVNTGAGLSNALEVNNHINPSFIGLNQNSDGLSPNMIGIELSEQCEGAHFDDIHQVKYGVCVKLTTGGGSTAPLATKISNSIFDQYLTAAIIAESSNGMEDTNNTFSYQDTAAPAPSVQIGGGSIGYKQLGAKFINPQKESVLLRNGSLTTQITALTVENGGLAGNQDDIRIEPNTMNFQINGLVSSGVTHNTGVNVQTGTSDNYMIKNIMALGAITAAVNDGGTGTNKEVDTGIS